MSPKRAPPKSTTQKQLEQLPLLKKPLEQIGKQIKIPGSFWEGTMTAEEKALEYFCTVRDFSAMHKFVGGDSWAAGPSGTSPPGQACASPIRTSTGPLRATPPGGPLFSRTPTPLPNRTRTPPSYSRL